jgi:hypothetical protein
MTHGRTFYRCGCIRVQCRCPGPHLDTVLPVECLKHRQERAGFTAEVDLLGDVWEEAPAYAAVLQRNFEDAARRVFERHAELFRLLAIVEDRERLIDEARD